MLARAAVEQAIQVEGVRIDQGCWVNRDIADSWLSAVVGVTHQTLSLCLGSLSSNNSTAAEPKSEFSGFLSLVYGIERRAHHPNGGLVLVFFAIGIFDLLYLLEECDSRVNLGGDLPSSPFSP